MIFLKKFWANYSFTAKKMLYLCSENTDPLPILPSPKGSSSREGLSTLLFAARTPLMGRRFRYKKWSPHPSGQNIKRAMLRPIGS